MKNSGLFSLLSLAATALLLQACAGTPKEAAQPMQLQKQDPNKQELNEKLDPIVAEAAKGYERIMKNGELMFCKREQPVGSRMWTTRCLTAVELKEQAENAKKFGEKTLEQGRRCSQGPACQPS